MRAPFILKVCCALVIVSLNHNVLADENSNWYVGASIGKSINSIDDGGIAEGLNNGGITTGGGLATSSITDNNSSTGGKIYVGYRLCNLLSLEGGYFDLGSLGFNAVTAPVGSLNGTLKDQGGNLDLVGTYLFDERSTLIARAGITYNQAKSDFSSSGAVQLLRSSYSENSTDYKIGVGLNYRISAAFSARLEAERYRLDDATNHQEYVSLLSIGVVYHY